MDNYSDKRFEQYDTHRSFNIWDTQHSTQSKPIVAIISNLCFSVYGFWLFLWDNWNTTTMPYAIGARFQGFLHFGQLAPLSVFFRFSFEFWIDQEQKWKKKKFLVSTSCYCNSIMHCHCSFYGGMNSKTFEVFKFLIEDSSDGLIKINSNNKNMKKYQSEIWVNVRIQTTIYSKRSAIPWCFICLRS